MPCLWSLLTMSPVRHPLSGPAIALTLNSLSKKVGSHDYRAYDNVTQQKSTEVR